MRFHSLMRLASVSFALATASSGTAHAHAGDHDREEQSCAAALESELLPAIREAAKQAVVTWRAKVAALHPTVKVQILGINDFHGRLSTGLRVASRPVGGAAVLASYLRHEQTTFAGKTLLVHAGDHVGATPPNSALLQDEPAIQFLNLLANQHCSYWFGAHPLCNVVGTLGNHEFDEGTTELLRLVQGGNSAKGPFLENPWRGARFAYVSSNVVDAESDDHLLPPYVVKVVDGERVGIVGAVLKETPSIVTPDGVRGLRFDDEVVRINEAVSQLKKRGVRTIVVIIHQGGSQPNYVGQTSSGAAAPSGRIVEIVSQLDGAVDVVISGHTHQFTNALVNNAAGQPVLVTQAFSSGTAYGDIELTIDRFTHDVVEKSARVVTTFADEGPGLTPAVDVAALVAAADAKVAPFVERLVGEAASALTRTQSAAGESALGNLIADAQRAAMQTNIALMNPGGIRADLDAGLITWGELFTIQPFGNDLVRMDLTGAQVAQVLEQQWSNPASPRFLQVSGLTYRWDPSRPVGSRIVSVSVAGAPLDTSATYSVTVNSFLAGGGDGFTVLTQGTSRVVGPVDLDALVSFVEASAGPIQAAIEGRIQSP